MKAPSKATLVVVGSLLIVVIIVFLHVKESPIPNQPTPPLEEQSSQVNEPNRDIRNTAKSKLQRKDLISKRMYRDSVEILNQLSDELSKSEGLTKAEALNELYIAVSAGQSGITLAGIKAIFGRSMIEYPEEIPERFSTMPAGELRTLTISYMRGTEIPLNLLKEIHSRIPESLDRSEIAGDLAVRLCLEEGRDEAQKFVDSIEFPTESKHAQQMLTLHLKLSETPDSPLTKPVEELLKEVPTTR